MKKIFLISILLSSSFFLSACVKKDTSPNSVTGVPTSANQLTQESAVNSQQCQPGDVDIEGYGDKGKRLANCFVQYPGEPSRQDKSYYIVEDICGQFTPQFISQVLGKQIIQAAKPKTVGLFNCSYYIDDKNYVMLVLDYLPIENQKKGHEAMDRKVVQDSSIPMKNLVVYQEDGQINSIYLVLSDNKFISIQRSSGIGLSSDELIKFTANIAQNIKDFK